jgi:lambda repressor-like predicted transcriptional regulator
LKGDLLTRAAEEAAYEYVGNKAIEDIKAQMKAQGVNQAELARRVGVTRVAMTTFLQRSNWQILTLLRAAKALDCRVIFEVRPLESGRIGTWSSKTGAKSAGTARRAATSTMAVAGRVVRKRTRRRSRTTASATKRKGCV